MSRSKPCKVDPAVESVETDDVVDPSLAADFEDLFGDGSQPVVVELTRISPAFYGGQPVAGFLCNLPPGATKSWIKDSWGGGRYRLTKKVSGKISTNRTLQIAGDPLLVQQPAQGGGVPEKPPDTEPSSPVSDLHVTSEGVVIGGSDQEFYRQMKQLLLVKSLLSQNDPNVELMKAFLSQKSGSNMMSAVSQLAEVFGQFRLLQGEESGSGGDTVMSLIKEGLKVFGQILEKRAGQTVDATSAIEPDVPRELLEEKTVKRLEPVVEPVRADSSLDKQRLIEVVVYQLVQGYRAGISAADVVDVLKQSVPLNPDVLNMLGIPGAIKTLKNLAVMELAEEFHDNPASKEAFGTFFDSVLAEYKKG